MPTRRWPWADAIDDVARRGGAGGSEVPARRRRCPPKSAKNQAQRRGRGTVRQATGTFDGEIAR